MCKRLPIYQNMQRLTLRRQVCQYLVVYLNISQGSSVDKTDHWIRKCLSLLGVLVQNHGVCVVPFRNAEQPYPD